MPFLWDIDTIVVEIEPWPRLCHWCRATVMDLFSNRHTKPERAWRSNLMIQLVSQSEAMWWEIEGSTLQMPRPQKRLHLLLFEILSGRAWVCTLFCELAPTRQVVTAICLHLCFYRAFYHRAPKALYTPTPFSICFWICLSSSWTRFFSSNSVFGRKLHIHYALHKKELSCFNPSWYEFQQVTLGLGS